MNVKTLVFMGVVSVILAESCHCDRRALSAWQRKWKIVKKEVIFNRFSFFCVSSHTFCGAVSCLSFRHLSMKWLTSEK
jgi:hypothetical protein